MMTVIIIMVLVSVIIAISSSSSSEFRTVKEREPLPMSMSTETDYYTDTLGWINNSSVIEKGIYVKDIENNYITIPGKTYKQVGFKHLEFISHNNNWQFIPHL